jgi:Family of unknown function (DUF5996)
MPEHDQWPSLPFDDWKDTCATLHLWTQMVGKIRLAQAPMLNHWWQVALYLTSSGLTTSPIPYGAGTFQIDFDFVDHALKIRVSDGGRDSFRLTPCAVADFYRELMGRLKSLGLAIRIWTVPVEIPDPIPFEEDFVHESYDPQHVHRFWLILAEAGTVMTKFRARFLGKASPVHFFWGSFDLAATRFSGRAAPPHPGGPTLADFVAREAYSREVSSCGFWPGNGGYGRPAFYSYAYPQPRGFEDAPVSPGSAFFSRDLGEFILPYDEMRQAPEPEGATLDFFQTTYDAAADLAAWDRASLERR